MGTEIYMTDITYGIVEETYCFGNLNRVSYGIAAYDGSNDIGDSAVIASIHDVTSDKQALEELIAHCNRLKISPIHLNDIVEDFLAT